MVKVGGEDLGRGIDLGPCCACGGTKGVRNLLALDKLAPIPGHGWGCFVCGLSPNGAQAVLCDKCVQRIGHRNPVLYLRWACTGYPGTEGRVNYKELQGAWRHNLDLHQPYLSGAR